MEPKRIYSRLLDARSYYVILRQTAYKFQKQKKVPRLGTYTGFKSSRAFRLAGPSVSDTVSILLSYWLPSSHRIGGYNSFLTFRPVKFVFNSTVKWNKKSWHCVPNVGLKILFSQSRFKKKYFSMELADLCLCPSIVPSLRSSCIVIEPLQ